LQSGSLLAAEGRGEVTRHALAAPAAAEQTVTSLARYLAPPAFSVEERAWSIFVWIGDRILYDVDAYLSGRVRDATVTAEDVLKRRVTVCDGYARLYAALAKAAGLEVSIIEGYAKAYGVAEQAVFSIPNHAWNLVLRDGRWDVIDPTWGGGLRFPGPLRQAARPALFPESAGRTQVHPLAGGCKLAADHRPEAAQG
jgi:transglutaminase/protease-like cytokinesis protein 3